MKLLNLIFLGLACSSLATAYPIYPVYPTVTYYEPAPIYYTPAPVYYPPVNVYTPPVIATPYYTDYYCPYCYDYSCYGCGRDTGKTLAALGIITISLMALGALVNS